MNLYTLIELNYKNKIMELTINYKGIDFDVEFDYVPSCDVCDEHLAGFIKIDHKGTCFLEFLEDCYPEIDKLILDKLHEDFSRF